MITREMFKLFLILQFFTLVLCSSLKKFYTPDGGIVGKKHKKYRDVTEVLGVPFAEPPIGKLRFRLPEPLQKRKSQKPFYAIKPANTCIYAYNKSFYHGYKGYDFWHPTDLKQSEDCLQLNMWVPKGKNLPVLVFIFGNGYDSGSPSFKGFNGAALAHEGKIIVVNLNYRLGILGFAYLRSIFEMPGNMGLVDQQFGLEWIYDNIKYFGGDKKRITLFGEGTGAASVTAHLFAPGSEKLFKRIIVNSGTIQNTWSVQNKVLANENLLSIAKKFKCEDKGEDYKIVECLQEVDARKLVEAAKSLVNPKQSPLVQPFIPVERDDAFFEGNVFKKLKKLEMKNDTDIMFGVTKHEASYLMPQSFFGEKYGCNFKKDKDPESKRNQCKMTKEQFYNVVKLIAHHHNYTKKDIELLKNTYKNYKVKEPRDWTVKLLSDFIFKCDMTSFALNLAKVVKGNKYFYQLDQMPRLNHWPKWMGVVHGYELLYEFGYPRLYSKEYSKKVLSKEVKMAKNMMKFIIKFVKEGKQSSKWKQFNDKKVPVAVIDKKYNYFRGPRKYIYELTKGCKVIREIQKEHGALFEFIKKNDTTD